MGTGVDHLQRRGSVYRWRRRLPHALALRPDHCISRSLDTADPDIARRRARACSAYFDVAMMRLMSNGIPPTREELARVLDDVFRRVLDDGERNRAEREEGAPDWIPQPQTDPRYEGVEPEDWDKVPTWPELWASEWQDAVLLNRLSDVEPLVEDALEARDLALPRTGTGWRRFLRLALLAAAGAHQINARREGGDYSQGWPMQCGIPEEQVPAFGPELSRPLVTAPPSSIPSPAPEIPTSTDTVLFSVSYAEFMASKPVWAKKTRAQADAVMSRFISLMDDKAVPDITQAVAEKFKQRLREVPALNGKSAYTGLTVRESIVAADRIAEALAAGKFPIRVGSVALDQDRASGLVQRLSLKTINRDLSFVADWGKWMENADARRTMLHRERNPFAGLLTKKSDVEKESRRSGRKRIGYAEEQVSVLLANLPTDDPGDDTARGRHNTRRFWAVLIAFHSGIRLGEISQLRVRDFKREGGVDFHRPNRGTRARAEIRGGRSSYSRAPGAGWGGASSSCQGATHSGDGFHSAPAGGQGESWCGRELDIQVVHAISSRAGHRRVVHDFPFYAVHICRCSTRFSSREGTRWWTRSWAMSQAGLARRSIRGLFHSPRRLRWWHPSVTTGCQTKQVRPEAPFYPSLPYGLVPCAFSG